VYLIFLTCQIPKKVLLYERHLVYVCARAAAYCSLGCPVSPTSTIKIRTILNLHPAKGSKLRNNYIGLRTRLLASEGLVTQGRLGRGICGEYTSWFQGYCNDSLSLGRDGTSYGEKKQHTANSCNVLREYEGIVYLRIQKVDSRRFHL